MENSKSSQGEVSICPKSFYWRDLPTSQAFTTKNLLQCILKTLGHPAVLAAETTSDETPIRIGDIEHHVRVTKQMLVHLNSDPCRPNDQTVCEEGRHSRFPCRDLEDDDVEDDPGIDDDDEDEDASMEEEEAEVPEDAEDESVENPESQDEEDCCAFVDHCCSPPSRSCRDPPTILEEKDEVKEEEKVKEEPAHEEEIPQEETAELYKECLYMNTDELKAVCKKYKDYDKQANIRRPSGKQKKDEECVELEKCYADDEDEEEDDDDDELDEEDEDEGPTYHGIDRPCTPVKCPPVSEPCEDIEEESLKEEKKKKRKNEEAGPEYHGRERPRKSESCSPSHKMTCQPEGKAEQTEKEEDEEDVEGPVPRYNCYEDLGEKDADDGCLYTGRISPICCENDPKSNEDKDDLCRYTDQEQKQKPTKKCECTCPKPAQDEEEEEDIYADDNKKKKKGKKVFVCYEDDEDYINCMKNKKVFTCYEADKVKKSYREDEIKGKNKKVFVWFEEDDPDEAYASDFNAQNVNHRKGHTPLSPKRSEETTRDTDSENFVFGQYHSPRKTSGKPSSSPARSGSGDKRIKTPKSVSHSRKSEDQEMYFGEPRKKENTVKRKHEEEKKVKPSSARVDSRYFVQNCSGGETVQDFFFSDESNHFAYFNENSNFNNANYDYDEASSSDSSDDEVYEKEDDQTDDSYDEEEDEEEEEEEDSDSSEDSNADNEVIQSDDKEMCDPVKADVGADDETVQNQSNNGDVDDSDDQNQAKYKAYGHGGADDDETYFTYIHNAADDFAPEPSQESDRAPISQNTGVSTVVGLNPTACFPPEMTGGGAFPTETLGDPNGDPYMDDINPLGAEDPALGTKVATIASFQFDHCKRVLQSLTKRAFCDEHEVHFESIEPDKNHTSRASPRSVQRPPRGYTYTAVEVRPSTSRQMSPREAEPRNTSGGLLNIIVGMINGTQTKKEAGSKKPGELGRKSDIAPRPSVSQTERSSGFNFGRFREKSNERALEKAGFIVVERGKTRNDAHSSRSFRFGQQKAKSLERHLEQSKLMEVVQESALVDEAQRFAGASESTTSKRQRHNFKFGHSPDRVSSDYPHGRGRSPSYSPGSHFGRPEGGFDIGRFQKKKWGTTMEQDNPWPKFKYHSPTDISHDDDHSDFFGGLVVKRTACEHRRMCRDSFANGMENANTNYEGGYYKSPEYYTGPESHYYRSQEEDVDGSDDIQPYGVVEQVGDVELESPHKATSYATTAKKSQVKGSDTRGRVRYNRPRRAVPQVEDPQGGTPTVKTHDKARGKTKQKTGKIRVIRVNSKEMFEDIQQLIREREEQYSEYETEDKDDGPEGPEKPEKGTRATAKKQEESERKETPEYKKEEIPVAASNEDSGEGEKQKKKNYSKLLKNVMRSGKVKRSLSKSISPDKVTNVIFDEGSAGKNNNRELPDHESPRERSRKVVDVYEVIESPAVSSRSPYLQIGRSSSIPVTQEIETKQTDESRHKDNKSKQVIGEEKSPIDELFHFVDFHDGVTFPPHQCCQKNFDESGEQNDDFLAEDQELQFQECIVPQYISSSLEEMYHSSVNSTSTANSLVQDVASVIQEQQARQRGGGGRYGPPTCEGNVVLAALNPENKARFIKENISTWKTQHVVQNMAASVRQVSVPRNSKPVESPHNLGSGETLALKSPSRARKYADSRVSATKSVHLCEVLGKSPVSGVSPVSPVVGDEEDDEDEDDDDDDEEEDEEDDEEYNVNDTLDESGINENKANSNSNTNRGHTELRNPSPTRRQNSPGSSYVPNSPDRQKREQKSPTVKTPSPSAQRQKGLGSPGNDLAGLRSPAKSVYSVSPKTNIVNNLERNRRLLVETCSYGNKSPDHPGRSPNSLYSNGPRVATRETELTRSGIYSPHERMRRVAIGSSENLPYKSPTLQSSEHRLTARNVEEGPDYFAADWALQAAPAITNDFTYNDQMKDETMDYEVGGRPSDVNMYPSDMSDTVWNENSYALNRVQKGTGKTYKMYRGIPDRRNDREKRGKAQVRNLSENNKSPPQPQVKEDFTEDVGPTILQSDNQSPMTAPEEPKVDPPDSTLGPDLQTHQATPPRATVDTSDVPHEPQGQAPEQEQRPSSSKTRSTTIPKVLSPKGKVLKQISSHVKRNKSAAFIIEKSAKRVANSATKDEREISNTDMVKAAETIVKVLETVENQKQAEIPVEDVNIPQNTAEVVAPVKAKKKVFRVDYYDALKTKRAEAKASKEEQKTKPKLEPFVIEVKQQDRVPTQIAPKPGKLKKKVFRLDYYDTLREKERKKEPAKVKGSKTKVDATKSEIMKHSDHAIKSNKKSEPDLFTKDKKKTSTLPTATQDDKVIDQKPKLTHAATSLGVEKHKEIETSQKGTKSSMRLPASQTKQPEPSSESDIPKTQGPKYRNKPEARKAQAAPKTETALTVQPGTQVKSKNSSSQHQGDGAVAAETTVHPHEKKSGFDRKLVHHQNPKQKETLAPAPLEDPGPTVLPTILSPSDWKDPPPKRNISHGVTSYVIESTQGPRVAIKPRAFTHPDSATEMLPESSVEDTLARVCKNDRRGSEGAMPLSENKLHGTASMDGRRTKRNPPQTFAFRQADVQPTKWVNKNKPVAAKPPDKSERKDHPREGGGYFDMYPRPSLTRSGPPTAYRGNDLAETRHFPFNNTNRNSRHTLGLYEGHGSRGQRDGTGDNSSRSPVGRGHSTGDSFIKEDEEIYGPSKHRHTANKTTKHAEGKKKIKKGEHEGKPNYFTSENARTSNGIGINRESGKKSQGDARKKKEESSEWFENPKRDGVVYSLDKDYTAMGHPKDMTHGHLDVYLRTGANAIPNLCGHQNVPGRSSSPGDEKRQQKLSTTSYKIESHGGKREIIPSFVSTTHRHPWADTDTKATRSTEHGSSHVKSSTRSSNQTGAGHSHLSHQPREYITGKRRDNEPKTQAQTHEEKPTLSAAGDQNQQAAAGSGDSCSGPGDNQTQQSSNQGLFSRILQTFSFQMGSQPAPERNSDSKDDSKNSKGGSGEGATGGAEAEASQTKEESVSPRKERNKRPRSPHINMKGARNLRPGYRENINSNASSFETRDELSPETEGTENESATPTADDNTSKSEATEQKEPDETPEPQQDHMPEDLQELSTSAVSKTSISKEDQTSTESAPPNPEDGKQKSTFASIVSADASGKRRSQDLDSEVDDSSPRQETNQTKSEGEEEDGFDEDLFFKLFVDAQKSEGKTDDINADATTLDRKKITASLKDTLSAGDNLDDAFSSVLEWNAILLLAFVTLFCGSVCPGLMRQSFTCPILAATEMVSKYVLTPLGFETTASQKLSAPQKITVWPKSFFSKSEKPSEVGTWSTSMYQGVLTAPGKVASFTSAVLNYFILTPVALVLEMFKSALMLCLQSIIAAQAAINNLIHDGAETAPSPEPKSSDGTTEDKYGDPSPDLVPAEVFSLSKQAGFLFYVGFDRSKLEECDFSYLTGAYLWLQGQYPVECM